MKSRKKTTLLAILDGYGYSDESYGNAISMAHTPNLDKIFATYPHTTLDCCGLAVGLPQGQMGNSEVGHMNIGSGRVIYQDLSKISKAIDDNLFFSNPALCQAMDDAIKNSSSLHLMGLLSDGGVHSHIDHLLALIDMAKSKGVSNLVVHCFLDGRDVPPKSALNYIDTLEDHMSKAGIGSIGTICGRYYAMDRDKRWDRLSKAYDAIVLGQGHVHASSTDAILAAYQRDETDEFMLPTVISPYRPMSHGDSVIFFNFRPDRARELTSALVEKDFTGFSRTKILSHLSFTTMTTYDRSISQVSIAYPPESYKNTLGEYLSSLGKRQLRIAETEKYAHVTFFFNGGIEKPYPLEDRVLIPSPSVATYDLQPEMSGYLVTERLIHEIKNNDYDLIVLNFANADMVGHTGDIPATIKAIETLDTCISQIVKTMLEVDGQILLTADHGNADHMLEGQNLVVTAHSLNPVPLVYIRKNPLPLKNGGKLSDIAPTLLDIMEIDIAPEMTGHSLIDK